MNWSYLSVSTHTASVRTIKEHNLFEFHNFLLFPHVYETQFTCIEGMLNKLTAHIPLQSVPTYT